MNIDILKELATLDPLDDGAFKMLVSDDDEFIFLAESISGETINDDKIIHMNGEILSTVKGKAIRADSLRGTSFALFNMEGQVKASDYPVKRHIYYTAAIYAHELEKGDKSWEKLKPVISIVIYKHKGDAPLFENATLSGSLMKTDDERKQLTLIAVNTAKWKDAPTEELRAYLATLHHGIMTEDNKDDFATIDVTAKAFSKVQKAVKIACAHTKKKEYSDKGDDSMHAILDLYITKEAKEEEQERAFDTAQKIIRMLKENMAVADIARECNVSMQRVESFRMAVS